MFWVLKKNGLIETVLLSTHNMFWLRNKKNKFLVRTLKACITMWFIPYSGNSWQLYVSGCMLQVYPRGPVKYVRSEVFCSI